MDATQDNTNAGPQENCNLFTKKLLDYSKISTILLCGPHSERNTISALALPEPYTIRLRGQEVRIWIRSLYSSNWQVLFSAPEPLAFGFQNDIGQYHRFGEIVKATSILTGIRLDPYIFERTSAYTRVYRQMALEKLDPNTTSEMTPTNLDPGIRHFLYRKGFESDEDLIKLEEITGSLARGICMLGLLCFPHRPYGSNPNKRRALQLGTSHEPRVPFSEKQKQQLRELYKGVIGKLANKLEAQSSHSISEPLGFEEPEPELSPTLIKMFAQSLDSEDQSVELDDQLDNSQDAQAQSIVQTVMAKAKARELKIDVPAPIFDGTNETQLPSDFNDDSAKRILLVGGIRTLRSSSDNPYLKTAVPGKQGIQVRCQTCWGIIGTDPEPTYAVLPPFQGFYLAPNNFQCISPTCRGKRRVNIPVDVTQNYVSHTDMWSVTKRHRQSLYLKLHRIFCEGDRNLVLSQKELDTPPWHFERKGPTNV
jgi:hypothetical protein